MQNTNSNDSELLHHDSCDACGSSDARAVYSDGGSYCFSCNNYKKVGSTMQTEFVQSKLSSGLLPFGTATSLVKRKITEATCKKFGYTVGEMSGQPVQIANYRDKNGTVVAQKVRGADKSFKFLGDAKAAGLFGQHLWRENGRMLIIVEGELDALSMSQVQGNNCLLYTSPSPRD